MRKSHHSHHSLDLLYKYFSNGNTTPIVCILFVAFSSCCKKTSLISVYIDFFLMFSSFITFDQIGTKNWLYAKTAVMLLACVNGDSLAQLSCLELPNIVSFTPSFGAKTVPVITCWKVSTSKTARVSINMITVVEFVWVSTRIGKFMHWLCHIINNSLWNGLKT